MLLVFVGTFVSKTFLAAQLVPKIAKQLLNNILVFDSRYSNIELTARSPFVDRWKTNAEVPLEYVDPRQRKKITSPTCRKC